MSSDESLCTSGSGKPKSIEASFAKARRGNTMSRELRKVFIITYLKVLLATAEQGDSQSEKKSLQDVVDLLRFSLRHINCFGLSSARCFFPRELCAYVPKLGRAVFRWSSPTQRVFNSPAFFSKRLALAKLMKPRLRGAAGRDRRWLRADVGRVRTPSRYRTQ